MNIQFPQWVTDSHCTGHTHRVTIHGRHGTTFPTYNVEHSRHRNYCAAAEAAKNYNAIGDTTFYGYADPWEYVAMGGEM